MAELSATGRPFTPTLLVFDQGSGIADLYEVGDIVRFHGYSGNSKGRNNALFEDTPNVGPLPRGLYDVSRPFDHVRKGPVVFRLSQLLGETFGRSGFLIHGDNAENNASSGCIILARAARDRIATAAVRTLVVI